MNKIFSNSNARKDHLRFVLDKLGRNTDVFIAVAFFTDARQIETMIDNGCTVRLIVRLGFPTSASSLGRILHKQDVHVRYYTGKDFHPKLYIFDSKAAFVGSSNLTDSGLTTNQELNISIDSEDPVFEELKEIFDEYWQEALPLDDHKLRTYEAIIREYQLEQAEKQADRAIIDQIGKVVFPNISRGGGHKKTQSTLLSEAMLRRYQIFLSQFAHLRETYEAIGRRKVTDDALPLRIEIDQFLYWIRVQKNYGDDHEQAPTRSGKELHDFLIEQIEEFLAEDFEVVQEVTEERYPMIKAKCNSEATIAAWSESDIAELVQYIHAFAARARYLGGEQSAHVAFLEENGIGRIRDTIQYLLYGRDPYTKRIARCIHDPDLRLRHFGESCVTELYGWVNNEDVPICNGTTLTAMQWLGYGEM